MTAFEYHMWAKLAGACMPGLTCVILVGGWKNEGNLCRKGVTIEVSPGVGGRVILAGKCLRENTI